jgi:hypothetical protein
MSTVLRCLTALAVVATFATPLAAQHPSAAPQHAPPTSAVPTVPAMPAPPVGGNLADFGQAMGAWGESLGQALGALGDSLGRVGAALGSAEQDETTDPSSSHRARVDSLKRAMKGIERSMARAHIAGHDWRDVARKAREAGVQARTAAIGGKDAIRQLLDRVRQDPEAVQLPSVDSFATGALSIPVGAMRSGTVATVNGNLDVYGMVAGNAIAVDGNVEVHPGAHVTGTAFAAGGEVHVDSGAAVDGEVRSLTGDFGPSPVRVAHSIGDTSSRWHNLRLSLMAVALVLMLGIGVLTFAEDKLDHVTATLADHFGRAAWYGIVGEIALGPALLVLIVGLAITIVGILAIPFAIVGYAAIAVGAGTLGFMAVAEATGTAILRSHTQASLTPRGAQLRAIVTGVSIYGGLWVLTALVGAESAGGVAVRAIAVVVTTVAITVGFGAVLVWRFDVRRANRLVNAAPGSPVDDAVWQTPTPVAGVAAARRPAPAAQTSEKSS